MTADPRPPEPQTEVTPRPEHRYSDPKLDEAHAFGFREGHRLAAAERDQQERFKWAANEKVSDLEARNRQLEDALSDMANQFAYYTEGRADGEPGLRTGGLSALEHAFDALGWTDPHPAPWRVCDEPGCRKEGTMGWPTRPGGTGPNGGYRHTCWDHSDTARKRALLTDPPPVAP